MLGFRRPHPWLVFIALFAVLSACALPDQDIMKRQQAQRVYGEAYMDKGDFTAALRELLKAEKLYADDHLLQHDIGKVYMAKGKPELAVARFKRALELKPDYSPAKNDLGLAYMALKDWDAAIVSFKSISDDLLYATQHFPLVNLGHAYFNKHEYDLAIQSYQKALELAPKFINAMLGLSRTYLAQGRQEDAVRILEKAAAVAPDAALVHLDLGRAYMTVKETTKAKNAFKKVVELSPDTPLAEQAKKELARL